MNDRFWWNFFSSWHEKSINFWNAKRITEILFYVDDDEIVVMDAKDNEESARRSWNEFRNWKKGSLGNRNDVKL